MNIIKISIVLLLTAWCIFLVHCGSISIETEPGSVNDIVEKHKVVIFTINEKMCPNCRIVKRIFRKLHERYHEVNFYEMSDAFKLMKQLEDATGDYTVPSVFINANYIGGVDEIQQLYASGKLKEILDAKKRIKKTKNKV